VRKAGTVSTKKDGAEWPNVTAFYEALLVGKAYTTMLDLNPGDGLAQRRRGSEPSSCWPIELTSPQRLTRHQKPKGITGTAFQGRAREFDQVVVGDQRPTWFGGLDAIEATGLCGSLVNRAEWLTLAPGAR